MNWKRLNGESRRPKCQFWELNVLSPGVLAGDTWVLPGLGRRGASGPCVGVSVGVCSVSLAARAAGLFGLEV